MKIGMKKERGEKFSVKFLLINLLNVLLRGRNWPERVTDISSDGEWVQLDRRGIVSVELLLND